MSVHNERFEELYASSFHAIFGYALRRCDGPEDAADVVAETFAIAWRRWKDVPAGDEARLWLYGVARNVLANQRRGAVRRHELSAALAAEAIDRTGPDPFAHAEFAAIGRVFRALPPAERELLSLIAWEGLDTAGLAKVLGCSRNAVRIRVHRARRRLARDLAAAGLSTNWTPIPAGRS